MTDMQIRFPDAEPTSARTMALELRQHLLNGGVVKTATIGKDSDDTADLGAVLQVVIGAPLIVSVATELAKGLADWIRARATTEKVTLELERDGDKLKVTGSADEVERLAEEWLKR